MSFAASTVGHFAHDAASRGAGEVCAVFRRYVYARFPGERYACIGDTSLGRGPLNALVADFRMPAMGERVELQVEGAERWSPPASPPHAAPQLGALTAAARGRVPDEGFGALVIDAHNSLSGHAHPALEALDAWLVGNALAPEAEGLIGLGPGLTPSGDDYVGGMLIALHYFRRAQQASGLWRWLQPRLARTSALSGAHLAAAATGEAHETLHECLETLCFHPESWTRTLERLDAVGHSSGWDSLAGVVAVARTC